MSISDAASDRIDEPVFKEPRHMQQDIEAPLRKRTHNLAHDLVAKLSQSILLGQLKPGEKLPSEGAICLLYTSPSPRDS